MKKNKRLMEASWWERLRGKLGVVLMGGAMFSKSLIQFSVNGRGCVPSLLFTWGQTMVALQIAVKRREWVSEWSRSVVSNSLRPLPGSSAYGILQARILEWVVISFSRGSSRPRDRTQVSRIAGRCFNLRATREAPKRREAKSKGEKERYISIWMQSSKE